MRIAVLADAFPAVSETFISNEVKWMAEQGNKIDVYCWQRTSVEFDVAGCRIHSFNLPRARQERPLHLLGRLRPRHLRHAPEWLNLRRYGIQSINGRLMAATISDLETTEYDVIHAHFGPNGLAAAYLRDIGRIKGPIITTFHGYDVARYADRLTDTYGRLFEVGDLFLTVNSRWREMLTQAGSPVERTHVHYLGVDCDRFFPNTKVRSEEDDSLRVLSVARLVEKKGIDCGLRAISMLLKGGHRVKYDVVGDGPLLRQYEDLAEELGIQDSVTFYGARSPQFVLNALKKSDVLLAPSRTSKNGDQEGIPVAIMEAMASGLPVVATNHSGIPELVQENHTGFLVPENRADLLSDRLLHLLQNPDLRSRFGSEGRAVVVSRFNVDTQGMGLLQMFKGVAQNFREQSWL